MGCGGRERRAELEVRLEEVEKAEAVWSCTLVRERDNHHAACPVLYGTFGL